MKTTLVAILILMTCAIHAQTGRGRVQIQDGTIVTDRGTLLRGAYDGITPWSTLSPKEYITQIKEHGLNCMHFYAECQDYHTVGENQQLIDSIVQWTRTDSLYLILTMNWSLDSANIDFVTSFWSRYAERYKDETHLIFEISNEPFFDLSYPFDEPYDSLTIAMERAAYDTIRHHAPETHIQFMSYWINHTTYDFMHDINGLGEDVDWSNASIASHGYNYSAEVARSFIRAIQDSGYAVMVTEVPVIHNYPASDELYANIAFLRVLEEEGVSYCNFFTPVHIMEKPYLYQSIIENSEVRWLPDFGTWPNSSNSVAYKNPYTPILPMFCDESSLGMVYGDDYEMGAFDYIWNQQTYLAYYNVDFEEGPDSLILEFSLIATESWIEIHLDSLNGPLVANCQLSTLPDSSRQKYTFPVSDFSGVHDIFVYFRSNSYTHSILNKILFVKIGVSAQQPPFNGQAFKLPCKIEAEDFDYGIQNTSYFDTDTINNGRYYRSTEVDIAITADSGKGHFVGWIEDGEWLEYTINSEKESIMDVQFRIACLYAGGKIQVKLDDQLLGLVEIPVTGSWDSWETISINNINIPAGKNQVIRLKFINSGFNLNWFNFIQHEDVSYDELVYSCSNVIYPNPANDYIRIKNKYEPGILSIKIFNIQGKQIMDKQVDSNPIDISMLPKGIYMIKMSVPGNTVIEKLIKQ